MAQSLYLPIDIKLLLGLELARAENSPYLMDSLDARGTVEEVHRRPGAELLRQAPPSKAGTRRGRTARRCRTSSRPNLDVLFCGINPGLYTAAVQQHSAVPATASGRRCIAPDSRRASSHPSEQRELLQLGIGITNVVARATAAADELTREELIEGGKILTRKVKRYTAALSGHRRHRRLSHGLRSSESEDGLAGRDHRRDEDLGAAESERLERELPGGGAGGDVRGSVRRSMT